MVACVAVRLAEQKELETMRKTHGTIVQTDSSGSSDSAGRPLTEVSSPPNPIRPCHSLVMTRNVNICAQDGAAFKFDLSPFKTSFAAGAAMKGVVDGLASLTDFIVSST